MDLLVRYFHLISIILLCGSLLAENILIGKSLTREELGRLAKVDALFGMSAVTALIAGLLLWFKYGKGFAFYAHNPVFYAKLGVFAVIGLLSIWPTVFFLKQRKGNAEETVAVPAGIVKTVRLELALALLIPFLAVSMAKGLGIR